MSAVFGAIAMLAAAAALGITPTMLTTTSAFAWEDNNKYQAATVAEEVAKEAANNVQTPDKWDNNLQVGIHKVQDQIADAAQEISNGKQGANEEQEAKHQYTPQHEEEYPAQEDKKNKEQESNEEYLQHEEKENYPAEQQHEYPTREHEEEYPAEEQMEYPPRTEEYPVEEQQHAYPPRHEEEYPTEVKMEYPPHEEKEYQTQGAESEEHTIQQENNNNNNDEGCSPNYWKNNLASWEVTRYSPHQKLSEVTDLGNAIPSEYDYTLLEALDTQNGGYDALAREFAAALLNSDHPNVKYALSTDKVIHNFEDGADPQIINSQEYYNDNDMQEQKNSLSDNNRAGCPL